MQFEAAKAFITDKLRRELSASLSYHSIHHIEDVYQSAEKLADMEGVHGEDRLLLLTAVLFHDAGFLKKQKEHERESCKIAKEYLPLYDYTKQQINTICGMIMATRLPQTPHNHLEEIICDADLDYLGRDDFFKIGDGLFSELSMYGIIDSEEDWHRLQLRFLESHHYFTKSAIALRKQKKDEHLEQIKKLVNL